MPPNADLRDQWKLGILSASRTDSSRGEPDSGRKASRLSWVRIHRDANGEGRLIVGRDSLEDYPPGHIPVERRRKLPTLAG